VTALLHVAARSPSVMTADPSVMGHHGARKVSLSRLDRSRQPTLIVVLVPKPFLTATATGIDGTDSLWRQPACLSRLDARHLTPPRRAAWRHGLLDHDGRSPGLSRQTPFSHWRQRFTAAIKLDGTGSHGYTLLVMAARSSRSWRHRSVAWRNSSSVVAAQSVRSWRSAACPGRTDSGETTHCRRQGGGTASRGGKESFSRGGRLLSSWCAAGLFVQVGRMGPHVFQAVVPQPESAVPPHLKRPTPFDFAPGFVSL
jgi:hypothetical protein